LNITIPDGLLEEIDQAASDIGETRSGFLQEAGARYVTAITEKRRLLKRAEGIKLAQRRAHELGERLAPGPDGASLVRELRDASPRWELEDDSADA
jgi:hypothetical protein